MKPRPNMAVKTRIVPRLKHQKNNLPVVSSSRKPKTFGNQKETAAKAA